MSRHPRGAAGQDPGSRAALWVCHSLYASALGFPKFPPLVIVLGGPRGTCAEPDGRVGVSPSEPLSRSGGSQVHPVWLTSSSAVVPAGPLVFHSLTRCVLPPFSPVAPPVLPFVIRSAFLLAWSSSGQDTTWRHRGSSRETCEVLVRKVGASLPTGSL